jgi:hypothetical protein
MNGMERLLRGLSPSRSWMERLHHERDEEAHHERDEEAHHERRQQSRLGLGGQICAWLI